MANKPETIVENAQVVLKTIGVENLADYFRTRLGERALSSRPKLLTAYATLDGLKALPLLLEVAKNEAELSTTRIAATKSLTRLAEQLPLQVNRATVIALLCDLLSTDDRGLRSAAAVSLCALRAKSAETQLRTLIDGGRLNLLAQEEARKFLGAIEASPIKSAIPLNASFFGRETELAEIFEAFKTSKIVVVLGLNGIGKTSLAAEYAKRSDYDVKVWLSGLRDATSVDLELETRRQVQTMLRENNESYSLPVPIRADSRIDRERLIKDLAELRVLMVIDDYQMISDKGLLANYIETFASQVANFDCLIADRFAPKELEAVCISVGPLHNKDASTLLESEAAKLGILPLEAGNVTQILSLAEGSPLLLKLIISDPLRGKSNTLTSSQHDYVVEAILKKSISGLEAAELKTLEVLAEFDEPIDLQSPILSSVFMDELIVSWPLALQGLQRVGLIVNNSDRLSFVHSLVREFVRQQTDSRTRRRINHTISNFAQS